MPRVPSAPTGGLNRAAESVSGWMSGWGPVSAPGWGPVSVSGWAHSLVLGWFELSGQVLARVVASERTGRRSAQRLGLGLVIQGLKPSRRVCWARLLRSARRGRHRARRAPRGHPRRPGSAGAQQERLPVAPPLAGFADQARQRRHQHRWKLFPARCCRWTTSRFHRRRRQPRPMPRRCPRRRRTALPGLFSGLPACPRARCYLLCQCKATDGSHREASGALCLTFCAAAWGRQRRGRCSRRRRG